MWIRLFISIVVGAFLGIVGSRLLFVGSWLSLIPWGVIGLAIGAISRKAERWLNGGLFGFCLTVAFMVAGYSGADPVMTKLPFFILLGAFGAACGIALALVGFLLWGLVVKREE